MGVMLLAGLVFVLPAALVSLIAHLKGYDPFMFFVIGLFSSFIGVLVVATLPDRIAEAEARGTRT
jgi:hypothetical protein